MVAGVTVLWIFLFLCKSSGVTHWRLQDEQIKPVNINTVITAHERCSGESCNEGDVVKVYDRELAIIIKSVQISKEAPWVPVDRVSSVGSDCLPTSSSTGERSLTLKIMDPKNPSNNKCHIVKKRSEPSTNNIRTVEQTRELSCGEPVEFTAYDFLKGIAQRNQLPPFPEPKEAINFRSSEAVTTIDMLEVESSLLTASTGLEQPPSVDLLGKIASYWRVKGNTLKAIECFRTALSVNPDHSDILLNLARLLYNHQYYDDVVFLTRKSLHVLDDPSSAWRHYFLLGEAHRQLKKYDEAVGFYKKTLELNPGVHGAEVHLRELARDVETNAYTIIIITTLVTIVLGIIYYLTCDISGNSNNNSK